MGKEGFARIRLTKEEIQAIFSVCGKLDMTKLGRDNILNWSSFLTKLKKFQDSAYREKA